MRKGLIDFRYGWEEESIDVILENGNTLTFIRYSHVLLPQGPFEYFETKPDGSIGNYGFHSGGRASFEEFQIETLANF